MNNEPKIQASENANVIKKDHAYPVNYDQSLVGICELYNPQSLNSRLFNGYENKLSEEDEFIIVNSNSYCKRHIANGGKKGEFQSMEIGYLNDSILLKSTFTETNFTTNNHIELGMSLDNFVSNMPKGNKFVKSSDGDNTVMEIKDSYHTYAALYKFKNDKLVYFYFGYSED